MSPRWSGRRSAASDFRQRYNSVVLAVHRNGVNITNRIAEIPLEIGDTLLVITPLNNLEALEATRDFVLTDAPEDAPGRPKTRSHHHHAWVAWAVLIGVVLVATLTDVFGGKTDVSARSRSFRSTMRRWSARWFCCGSKIVTPREAYASIDWQVLLMLYGLLGLGMAMQYTGTAEVAGRGHGDDLAQGFVAPAKTCRW